MSETQNEIDEREQFEPDEDAEMFIIVEPEWVAKLRRKLGKWFRSQSRKFNAWLSWSYE